MHPYMNKIAALSTMHGKEQAIAEPFNEVLHVSITVSKNLNTDLLGTFSGEVEREDTPIETLRKKARLGMKELGLSLGMASEGSFGPHPQLPLIAADHEMLVWIDDDLGIEIVEQEISIDTNFSATKVHSWQELTPFIEKVKFPSHALIVRSNSYFDRNHIFKGLTTEEEIKEAIKKCTSASEDGLAHIETDMRAHMNPTRMKVINGLAKKLASRLFQLCPKCSCPGWGKVDVVVGLPCELCGLKTKQISHIVYGCPRCEMKEVKMREDGVLRASSTYCDWCNP
ncbi:DUF6671 family protein [Alkalihalobacillus sp. LMS39]|uniref:DUF6671 family protein n=1 Tax=Alkalihalobacillus sp. LMS39 TaxID=2924032 RepID=UPI001FB44118|nr:DUF6671 family protein [Alkalihalobacillus sp. LMS39]UOE93855.1 hypothetical protein MM271_22215 [Alkalihalobacillus sp. LMS39]